jgi:hypothetical protein
MGSLESIGSRTGGHAHARDPSLPFCDQVPINIPKHVVKVCKQQTNIRLGRQAPKLPHYVYVHVYVHVSCIKPM